MPLFLWGTHLRGNIYFKKYCVQDGIKIIIFLFSEEAQLMNKQIFETIYFAAMEAR